MQVGQNTNFDLMGVSDFPRIEPYTMYNILEALNIYPELLKL